MAGSWIGSFYKLTSTSLAGVNDLSILLKLWGNEDPQVPAHTHENHLSLLGREKPPPHSCSGEHGHSSDEGQRLSPKSYPAEGL